MNQATRSVLFGALSFVLAGAVAYAVGRTIGGDDAAAAGLPTFEAPDAVIIPIPVAGDDFDAFAAVYVEDLQASREAASTAGVTLTQGSGFVSQAIAGGAGTGTAESGADGGGPATDAAEESPGSGGFPSEAPPADDRVIDLCADGGDECPEGVGGTVLLAIRDVPLSGFAAFNPPVPGTGRGFSRPVCPAGTGEDGQLVLGVSSSRPVVVQVRYEVGTYLVDRVEGEFEVTTSEAADARWTEWLLDDGIPNTDPRAWIQHCIALPELPSRSAIYAFITLVDKYDPSITYGITRVFTVPDDGLSGIRRRPTSLLGYGIDDLRVGLTSTPLQEVVVVAVPDAAPGACDTGGVNRSVIDRPDAIRGLIVLDETIPEEVIRERGYPYSADYTKSLVFSVGLQEGTDYIVCIYWFGLGRSFEGTVVQISEEVAVGTPEAYRPRLTLRDIANTFGTASEFVIGGAGCSLFESDELAISRTGAWDWIGEPQELCNLETDLTRIQRRGIRLRTAVTSDGVEVENFPSIRLSNLRCGPAECRLRLNEVAVVPLPRIPTERRLCGSGFGSGCGEDVEVPMRSVGDAVFEIAYIDVPGNGRMEWSIDEASEFADTSPELAEIPQLDVTVTFELGRGGIAEGGAKANVTVSADRPVSLRVEVDGVDPAGDPAPRIGEAVSFPPCRITETDDFGDSLPYEQPDLMETHSFSFGPLCFGSDYQLLVTAQDADGTEGVVVGRRAVGPYTYISVPPAIGLFNRTMTATIEAPNDSDRFVIEISPIRFVAQTINPSSGGQSLHWIPSSPVRARVEAFGWVVLSTSRAGYSSPAGITICGLSPGLSPGPGLGSVAVDTLDNRGVPLGQEQNFVSVGIDIWRAESDGSAPVQQCRRGESVESIRLQATVSLLDLVDGVTLTSESGNATVTIRLATLSPTLPRFRR